MPTVRYVRVVRNKKSKTWSVYIGLDYKYPRKRGIGAVGRDWNEIKAQFPKYLQPYIGGLRDIIKNWWKPIDTGVEKIWYKEF